VNVSSLMSRQSINYPFRLSEEISIPDSAHFSPVIEPTGRVERMEVKHERLNSTFRKILYNFASYCSFGYLYQNDLLPSRNLGTEGDALTRPIAQNTHK
jgi:hypothetical protein